MFLLADRNNLNYSEYSSLRHWILRLPNKIVRLLFHVHIYRGQISFSRVSNVSTLNKLYQPFLVSAPNKKHRPSPQRLLHRYTDWTDTDFKYPRLQSFWMFILCWTEILKIVRNVIFWQPSRGIESVFEEVMPGWREEGSTRLSSRLLVDKSRTEAEHSKEN